MRQKERTAIIIGSFLLYAVLLGINLSRRSQWMWDTLITIAFLSFVYSINRWLRLQKTGLILLNFALLAHNLGMFGWYAWSWGAVEYDNVVHLISSACSAYIVFNFVAQKLHMKKSGVVEKTVVDEHRAILLFLVIATVSALGTLVEVIEFLGFNYLEPGEGILFTGEGDSGKLGKAEGQYGDTMGDILVNTLGSVLGAAFFYRFKYVKRAWLRQG